MSDTIPLVIYNNSIEHKNNNNNHNPNNPTNDLKHKDIFQMLQDEMQQYESTKHISLIQQNVDQFKHFESSHKTFPYLYKQCKIPIDQAEIQIFIKWIVERYHYRYVVPMNQTEQVYVNIDIDAHDLKDDSNDDTEDDTDNDTDNHNTNNVASSNNNSSNNNKPEPKYYDIIIYWRDNYPHLTWFNNTRANWFRDCACFKRKNLMRTISVFLLFCMIGLLIGLVIYTILSPKVDPLQYWLNSNKEKFSENCILIRQYLNQTCPINI